MKIENLETDTNIVIMKLRDFKNASNSREKYYKCWRKTEEQKELLENKIKKSIEILENMKLDNSSACRYVLEILKGE